MRVSSWFLAAIASLSMVQMTHADLTPVENPWASPPPAGAGEWNVADVMQYIYGTYYERIDDNLDKIWFDTPPQNGSAQMLIIYSGGDQSLKVSRTDGSLLSAAILSGSASAGGTPSRTGSSVSFEVPSNPFLFVNSPQHPELYDRWYSDPSLNPGNEDHMITFHVSGYLSAPGNPDSGVIALDAYVLALEDRDFETGDEDYNDFMIEVGSVSTAVPDCGPMAVLLGLGLMGLRACHRRIRE